MMVECDLARAIATWLGSTTHNRIFIEKSGQVHELVICSRRSKYNFDYRFAIIGDTWVTAHPGVHIEAADPEFFKKLELVIKEVEDNH